MASRPSRARPSGPTTTWWTRASRIPGTTRRWRGHGPARHGIAPLRAPEGEIFGTLAVSWEQAHETTADELELLQSLADIAAIAIANARLYEQMTDSGRRYRFLVDNSPDLIWTVDKDGSFTYLSETVRSLIGWGPEELIGHHFAEIVAP